MPYIIEHLPRAGITIAYQFSNGKFHRAVVDTGIVMTSCGIHRQLPVARKYTSYLKNADPNKDSFHLWSTQIVKSLFYNERMCAKCLPYG